MVRLTVERWYHGGRKQVALVHKLLILFLLLVIWLIARPAGGVF
jgi:hypothetical protein